MATPSTSLVPGLSPTVLPIHFTRNIPGLPGSTVTIDVTSADTGQVLLALSQDLPLPMDDVNLGDIKVQAGGSGQLGFDGGAGTVTFSAKGSAFAGIMVSPNPQKIKDALKRQGESNSVIQDAEMPGIDANFRYWMLRWGYDATAAAKGAIALGGSAGQISFGANGSVDGLYAVVRRLPKTDIAGQPAGAFTQLSSTVNSWILPTQFRNIGDVDPGTWIISEVDGALALSLSAQYGYNFNWMRKAALGGLSGDIGLKIQMGIFASLGFNASGSFAVILSRDTSAPVVRLRLMKLDRKGWDFALNASAAVQADPGPLMPEKFNDFIAGVLGVHGLQVLKDIETWTDPSARIQDLLGSTLVDRAEKLLTAVTGIDAHTEFDKAKQVFQKFLTQWKALPHAAASSLYDIVGNALKGQAGALAAFKNGLQVLANGDEKSLAELIAGVNFSRTPIGQFVELALSMSALDALTNQLPQLRTIAQDALGILDGSTLEKLLTGMQQQIDSLLGIDKIQNLTFDKLNDWLKQRLSDWLGKNLDLQEFTKIQTIVRNLSAKAGDFYSKAREALSKKYSFEFAGKWQTTSTGSALLDIEFDVGGPNTSTVLDHLLAAIRGQFNVLLQSPAPIPGITLHKATLSHGVRRQSHIEVTLPFLSVVTDHINQSLASTSVVDHDGVRLLVFEVGATDRVTLRGHRDSRLAIAFTDKVPAGSARVHDVSDIQYDYSFRQVTRAMRKDQLAFQARPLFDSYFSRRFAPPAQSVDTWLGDFDSAVTDATHNPSNLLGDTLLSLDVALPGKYVGAWFGAPQDDHDKIYKNLSLRLQQKLKELFFAWYTQDPAHFKSPTIMLPLLVYRAIPPAAPVGADHQSFPVIEVPHGKFIWDATDDGQRRTLIFDAKTKMNLAVIFDGIQQNMAGVLSSNELGFYKRRRIDEILNQLANGIQGGQLLPSILGGLFFTEAELVRHSVNAALDLANFVANSGADSDQARQHLEKFGSNVTSTFNQLDTQFSGGTLTALGTMLFVEAAIVFNPALPATDINSLLDLTVVKNFDLPAFIDKQAIPTSDQVILEQKVPSMGASS